MRCATLYWAVCLSLAFTVASPTARTHAADAAAVDIVPDDWRTLYDRWSTALTELNVPATSVAVVKDDKLVLLGAMGIRDPDSRAPATPDSPFYIASSTKSFTAMAVAILVDEGKLALDDPVKKYLTRFELKDAALSDKITIRDLLAHRQGIDSGPIAVCEAYTGLINEDRYYRLLKNVSGMPRFRYSNLNFTLAGRVIEAVSGQPWQQFIAERILDPASMTHSYCLASRLYADAGAALPVIEVDGKLQVSKTRKTDATMHAAGGMGASAADLARWLRLNLNLGTIDGRRILSETMSREMQTQQIKVANLAGPGASFPEHGYGLGWCLGNYREHPTVFHFGGYNGARCHISFIPSERIGVAVLVNESGPAYDFADWIAAEAFDKLLGVESEDRLTRMKEDLARTRERMAKRPPIEDHPPAAGKGLSLPIGSYVGGYYHDDWGLLEVGADDGRLTVQLGAHAPTLDSTADDHFTSNLIPGDRYQCEFEVDDAGKVIAVMAKSTLRKARFVRQ